MPSWALGALSGPPAASWQPRPRQSWQLFPRGAWFFVVAGVSGDRLPRHAASHNHISSLFWRPRILELGSGTGAAGLAAAAVGAEVVLTDHSNLSLGRLVGYGQSVVAGTG